jgi:hypothetical protein
MSILHFDGFDDEHALLGKWQSSVTATPSYAESTRYGIGKAFRTTTSSGRLTKPIPASAQIIVGFAFKVANLTSTHVLCSTYGDSGATQHAVLRTSTTGQLQALRSGTTLTSSSAGLILANAWNYVEMRATIADSGGVFEVLLNGTQVINFTGDTKNAGTATNFDMIALGGSSDMDLAVTYDDVYVLNTSGSAPWNTFLGEVVATYLKPNGAGATTGLTPTGSATNWQNVDETPATTADYNASDVVGTKDTYALENLPASAGTVFAVQEVMVAAKTGVGAASIKSVVRSGGTDYAQSPVALGATPLTYTAIRETDPATGVAWTNAAVDALEHGAEVA